MSYQSVDQALLPAGVSRRAYSSALITAGSGSSGSGGSGIQDTPWFGLQLEPATATSPPNLVGSLCTDGLHRPLFDYDDLDINHGLAAVETLLGVTRNQLVAVTSTTHWHIYVPTVAYTWHYMQAVLEAALARRIINHGYYRISTRDGGCYLRLPGRPWTAKLVGV